MLSACKWQCIFTIIILVSPGHSSPTTRHIDAADVSSNGDDHSTHSTNLNTHPNDVTTTSFIEQDIMTSDEVAIGPEEVSGVATTTRKPLDQQNVLEYLKKYGYMGAEEEGNLESPAAMKDLSTMLTDLQDFAGLNTTGVLDEETVELMNKPRCQLPDIIKADSKFGKRYLARAKWRKRTLSYRVGSYPTKSYNLRSRSLVNSLIARGFKDWSDVANVNFYKRNAYSRTDIDVRFYSRYHGDYKAFDGPGKVLAHAFYPQSGRLHFDNDERWSSRSYGGPNLRQVATHEVGHILGLGHSRVRGAVMYPYYTYRSNFKLQPDDVRGAVYLYGRKGTITTRRPRTTTRKPRCNWWCRVRRWF